MHQKGNSNRYRFRLTSRRVMVIRVMAVFFPIFIYTAKISCPAFSVSIRFLGPEYLSKVEDQAAEHSCQTLMKPS